MIFGRVRGAQAMEQRLAKLSAEIERQAALGVREGAYLVEARAKRLVLDKPKSGRIYPLPSGGAYQASAPGEAPANRMGFLVTSIVNWTLPKKLTLAVGSRIQYARFLEFGTRHMKPRSFLRRSLREVAKQVREIIRKRISAAVASTKK